MKKPEKKLKKIHSLRHQITAYFIGLLFLSILTITVINGAFLEKYYVTKKIDVLLDLRTTLENTDIDKMMNSDSSEGSESIPDEIQRACSRNNLSWVIIDSSNTSWLSWGENEKMLQSKLFGYVYDLDEDGDKSRTLKQGDNYTIQQSHDRFAGMDYVECWGQLDDEHYFIIRTPLESIRESANISNKFYFAVGLAIIVVSGLMIMLVTKRITRPISELTDLSKKMSDLDFEAKYESKVGNEIDVLGDNFNRMSSQLETTISELKSANNELQRDIEDKIKLEYASLNETFRGAIVLDEKPTILTPTKGLAPKVPNKKTDTLQSIIDKVNERFNGNFTDSDRVIIEGIYQMFMKDSDVKKFKKYAKDNSTEMFVQSLFPDKFKDIVTQCFLDNNDSFSKLFNDPDFYNKVQEAMAAELYKALRKD